MNLNPVIKAIETGEDFMLKRLYKYASKAEYTKYTSTKEDDWRMTLREPGKGLIKCLKRGEVEELPVDEDLSKSPGAGFGIKEARLHRKRGVTFHMFRGLAKLVRQSFIDLINAIKLTKGQRKQALDITNRFFDKFELGFSSEWAQLGDQEALEELQVTCREMTNEKNRYRTIFHSMAEPAMILGSKKEIIEVNPAFEKYFSVEKRRIKGNKYTDILDFEGTDLIKGKIEWPSEGVDAVLLVQGERRYVSITLAKLDDISKKNVGNVVILRNITEHKKAEDALQESKTKYRDLYDKAPDMYHSLDKKGIITECNKTEAKMLGYKKEEIIGRPLTDFFTEESTKLFKKQFKWVSGKQKGKRLRNVEREFVRKDGTTFSALLNVFAEFDKGGKFTGTKTISRNITERKKVEEALQKSEEKYRELYETAPVMLHTLDRNGVLIDCNRALSETLGYSREEMIGRPVHDFQTKESRALAPKALKEVVKTGSLQGQRDFISKDGRTITLEFDAHVERTGKQGEIVIKTASKDITERKKAEKKIEESERKYRTLFENMLDGFAYCKMLFDKNNKPLDFIYLEVNDAFERLTTLKKEAVVGKRVTEAMPGIKEAHPELFDIYGKVALTGEDTEFEIYFKPLDIWLSISVFSPEKGYFVAIFDNITERKKVEEKMKKRLMKFNLEGRNLYLVKEPAPATSIEAFNDLLKVGYHGLVISRTPKEEFEKVINGDSEFLRLAEKGGEKSLTPKLREIEHRIESLPGKRAILLDRLDYLVFKNSYKQTLSFVQNLREMAYFKGHVIILSIDPSVFKGQELRLLEKEAREVEPIHRGRMPEDLLEILKFIYKQNTVGIKPSYGDIKKEMGISKPTARKRIKRLIVTGYLTDVEKGRTKIVEITEKGTSLFLR